MPLSTRLKKLREGLNLARRPKPDYDRDAPSTSRNLSSIPVQERVNPEEPAVGAVDSHHLPPENSLEEAVEECCPYWLTAGDLPPHLWTATSSSFGEGHISRAVVHLRSDVPDEDLSRVVTTPDSHIDQWLKSKLCPTCKSWVNLSGVPAPAQGYVVCDMVQRLGRSQWCPLCTLLHHSLAKYGDKQDDEPMAIFRRVAKGSSAAVTGVIVVAALDAWMSDLMKLRFERDSSQWLQNYRTPFFDMDSRNKSLISCSPIHSCPLGILPSRVDVPRLADEASIASAAQTWIKRCAGYHSCIPQDEVADSLLPTRVIAVEDGTETNPPKLLISNGRRGRYLCLSHCWGKDRPYDTTKANIRDRQRALETDKMPRTFREAIQLTRRLGIAYLWIDALCIVQDDKDDWAREAMRMADIYSCSYLTLAAAHAASGHDGLLPTHPYFTSRQLVSQTGGAYHVLSRAVLPKRQYADATLPEEELPLFSRGWVCQETALSPRTLICGRDEVAWACRQSWERQYGREIEVKHGRMAVSGSSISFKSLAYYARLQAEERLDIRLQSQLQGAWKSMVTAYTSMAFTKEDDRPAALAGIVSVFQDAWGADSYLAGLWKRHAVYKASEDDMQGLLHHLAWYSDTHRDPSGSSSTSLNAMATQQPPTWSWLSHRGRVQFVPAQHLRETTRVCEAFCEPSSAQMSLIEVRGGRLVLSGPAVWGEYVPGQDTATRPQALTRGEIVFGLFSEIGMSGPLNIPERSFDDSFKSALVLDRTGSLGHGTGAPAVQVLCLSLFLYEFLNGSVAKHAMILKPSAAQGFFERVGLAKVCIKNGSQDPFAGAPDMDATIV